MNIKTIKKNKGDIYKSSWVLDKKRQIFKKVNLNNGPSIFTIYIHYEDYTLKITNNEFHLYTIKKHPYKDIIEYKNKEYMSYDDFFNYSTIYDIPSPDELKEIRKYGKKFLKNRSLVFIGSELK